jgi:hypothetical protein
MSNLQTDNSYLEDKIKIREKAIQGRSKVKVLDCFAGEGLIWSHLKNRIKVEIEIIGIDKKKTKKLNLIGDNRKWLKSLNLNKFDIIDLDAYGIPFDQLEIIFKREYKGIVVVTFIQSMYGCLNKKMLQKIGYTDGMIKKIPSLIYRDGYDKILLYLALNGVKKIYEISRGKKHYFYFNLKTDQKEV